jgi:hypothetical protein
MLKHRTETRRQECARALYAVKGPFEGGNTDQCWLPSLPVMFEIAALNSIRLGLWVGNAGSMAGLLFTLQLRVAACHKVWL